MRTLSIMAFASFLVLWGVYSYLRDDSMTTAAVTKKSYNYLEPSNDPNSRRDQMKRRDLDKIGNVINEKNADIDAETKEEIKVAKSEFETAQSLKEKQVLLEQSYMDRASSIKDIKRLQSVIIDAKNKLKSEVANTEKWDPKFVYYLMMQENYTYQEINGIRSLSENGLNPEEINYINELIKEEAFMDRISSFKSQGNVDRAVASIKKAKEKDDFLEGTEDHESRETKLIEMDYNQEERQEMVYGNNQ